MNRSETFFLRTASDAKTLCEEIGHPRIGVTIDTFHANIEEKSISRAIQETGNHLKHVHASENDRGLLGTGHIDFPSIISILQQLDYLEFIDIYHERIKMFHVKDAEFRPNGRQGVYGGYQPWLSRAGRFRSLGDGQVDFPAIFSKLAQYDFEGWAVLEWECCVKNSEQGAREGAPFIARHIIQTAERAFDDFAKSGADDAANRRMLGLEKA